MKILMLCTKFSIVPNDGWLTNELAVALQSCGHNIQVIVIGWTDDAKGTSVTTKIVDDVDVMLVSAKPIRLFGMFIYKVTKWAPASFVARRHIKTLLGNQSFDLVLCFSPAWTVYALIRWAKRRFDCRRTSVTPHAANSLTRPSVS